MEGDRGVSSACRCEVPRYPIIIMIIGVMIMMIIVIIKFYLTPSSIDAVELLNTYYRFLSVLSSYLLSSFSSTLLSFMYLSFM